MASATSQSLKALINRVESTEGFRVLDQGVRWKITNEAGGRDLFVAKRPPFNNTLKHIHDKLAGIGWVQEEVDAAQQNGSRARLDADRERNEARLQAAVAEAARRAEEDRRNANNRDAAKALSATALSIGHGHRKAILEIDAGFAKALLEHNNFFVPTRAATAPVGRCNRPFDPRLEEEFRGKMLRGEMKLTHQGIALDTEGTLGDGQHRLAGLVKAAETNPDVTFVTEVTYDLDPDSMPAIDAGKGRLKTDHLAFRGEVNRLVLASALTLIWKYDNFPIDEWRDQRISTDQMFAVLDANPQIRDAVRIGGLARHITIASAASAFIFLAERVYRDAPMESFLHGIQWRNAVWKITEDFPRPIERD